MKRFGSLLGLLVLTSFVSSAAGINIKEATIQNGQVFIAGDQAQRRAAISWEGVALGIDSNNGGAFQIITTNLPADCIGQLQIGNEVRDVVINNCTPAPPPPIIVFEAGVPRTGQLTSFAPGDDGDLRQGVSTNFAGLFNNGNGTLTDHMTKLTWLNNMNCPVEARDWATALTDVASLNADGTMNGNDCGDTSNEGSHQTDWRLPNVRELESLNNFGSPSLPSIRLFGTAAFRNNAGVLVFWSSTTVAANTNAAWVVWYGYGQVEFQSKGVRNHVIAVRGPV